VVVLASNAIDQLAAASSRAARSTWCTRVWRSRFAPVRRSPTWRARTP
jgi:hypothetical protein